MTLAFSPQQDTKNEPNERFFATLISPSGATLAVAQGKVTIKDKRQLIT